MRLRGWLVSLLMCALAPTFRTAACSAQGGIDLSWTDCGAFGHAARTFACTSNATVVGSLIASVVPPVDVAQLNGCSAIVDLQTIQPILSLWWHLEPGACRSSALAAGFDFTAGPSSCVDAWAGEATGGLTYLAGYGGLGRAHIVIQCSIPGTREMSVVTEFSESTEYEVFKLVLGGQKSTGEGSCGGCTDGACILLRSITLTQASVAPSFTLTAPLFRQFVAFQPGGAANCPWVEDPVPARTRTWGAVKSLYR